MFLFELGDIYFGSLLQVIMVFWLRDLSLLFQGILKLLSRAIIEHFLSLRGSMPAQPPSISE